MHLRGRPGAVYRLLVHFHDRDLVFAAPLFCEAKRARAQVATAVRRHACDGALESIGLQRGTTNGTSEPTRPGRPIIRNHWEDLHWTEVESWGPEVVQRILQQHNLHLRQSQSPRAKHAHEPETTIESHTPRRRSATVPPPATPADDAADATPDNLEPAQSVEATESAAVMELSSAPAEATKRTDESVDVAEPACEPAEATEPESADTTDIVDAPIEAAEDTSTPPEPAEATCEPRHLTEVASEPGDTCQSNAELPNVEPTDEPANALPADLDTPVEPNEAVSLDVGVVADAELCVPNDPPVALAAGPVAASYQSTVKCTVAHAGAAPASASHTCRHKSTRWYVVMMSLVIVIAWMLLTFVFNGGWPGTPLNGTATAAVQRKLNEIPFDGPSTTATPTTAQKTAKQPSTKW